MAASRHGRIFGAAAANYQLESPDFAAALVLDAGMLVPEYELKRNLIEPARGALDFSAADALWAFAQRHQQGFRGHPLVWHAANPPWLEDAVLASRDARLLTDYVTALAAHFRGRIHSWDVVNEALRPEEGLAGGLRNSFWLKAFGPAYIDMAFHAARAADPAALLIYNDFGCEDAEPANDKFRAMTLDLLEGLLARNVPLDGYGMQGHLSAYGPTVDQRKLGRFLADVESMGLKIMVTELDVDDRGGPMDSATRDRAVADAGRKFLDVAMDSRAVIGVLTWGLSDRYLRAEGMKDLLLGYSPRKLPLDPALERTPLWYVMAEELAAK